MSEIPSDSQIGKWYQETLKIPSFIKTLTPYQADKLLQYSKNEVERHFRTAARLLDAVSESNFPKGLPMENWLEHIVYKNMGYIFSEATFILNLFGWHWTLEKHFYRIEEHQPNKTPIKLWRKAPIQDINPEWERLINEGEKLTVWQIALICYYELNIIVPRPSKTNDIADKIALFHGKNSGENLYHHYLIAAVKTDRLNEYKPQKTQKDIEKILKFLSTEKSRDKAKVDLEILKDKITSDEI